MLRAWPALLSALSSPSSSRTQPPLAGQQRGSAGGSRGGERRDRERDKRDRNRGVGEVAGGDGLERKRKTTTGRKKAVFLIPGSFSCLKRRPVCWLSVGQTRETHWQIGPEVFLETFEGLSYIKNS